jgi:hypothetical protein
MAGKGKGLVEKAVDAVTNAAAQLVGGGEQSNDKVERAEEFAERAEDHREHVAAEDALTDYGRAQLSRVAFFGNLPSEGELTLRLAAGDTFLPDSETIAVPRDAMIDDAAGPDRRAYDRKIDFDGSGPLVRLTEAWLIASNGDAVCCDLGGVGLTVGGGHQGQIPAKHLLF